MPRIPALFLALLAAACAGAPRGVPLPMAAPLPTSVDLGGAYRPEGNARLDLAMPQRLFAFLGALPEGP